VKMISSKDCGKNIAPPKKKRVQPRSWKKMQRHVGGDVDIVAGITKLGEQVAGNTKLE
jgi:hypothetical protein